MKFSLNLNKIALLRNARGENNPSLEDYANQAINLGVDGLTSVSYTHLTLPTIYSV